MPYASSSPRWARAIRSASSVSRATAYPYTARAEGVPARPPARSAVPRPPVPSAFSRARSPRRCSPDARERDEGQRDEQRRCRRREPARADADSRPRRAAPTRRRRTASARPRDHAAAPRARAPASRRCRRSAATASSPGPEPLAGAQAVEAGARQERGAARGRRPPRPSPMFMTSRANGSRAGGRVTSVPCDQPGREQLAIAHAQAVAQRRREGEADGQHAVLHRTWHAGSLTKT